MANRSQDQSLPLRTLCVGVVIVWVIMAAFPFLWTACGSFKVEPDFMFRVDWMNAITGPATVEQTGSAFTDSAYEGAWIEQQF